jgi:hypothetical protein
MHADVRVQYLGERMFLANVMKDDLTDMRRNIVDILAGIACEDRMCNGMNTCIEDCWMKDVARV